MGQGCDSSSGGRGVRPARPARCAQTVELATAFGRTAMGLDARGGDAEEARPEAGAFGNECSGPARNGEGSQSGLGDGTPGSSLALVDRGGRGFPVSSGKMCTPFRGFPGASG